jgi:alpha-tubulin suppressor-like RCC1 family protein
VAIQDASGSTLTGATDTVTIALGTNPGAATLLGTKTVKAVNGVAVFDALSVQKAGTGYTLTSASGPLTGATSAPFSIVAAPSSQLQFRTQPSNTTAGAPFSPSIEVTITDAFGNTVTTATDQVSLVLGLNPGGATLLGTPTVTAVAGVARFSNLVIQKAASGYAMTASAGSLLIATSTPFSIVAAAAAQLLFSVQPTDGQGNIVMPPVAVTIRDAFGNFATDSVTLTIGANPWGGVGTTPGTLSGTTRRGPVNGMASFGDLRIDKPGAGYTLLAAAGSATGPSAPFHVGLTFSSVAAGGQHTCALTTGGTYCWGWNFLGQLGGATGAIYEDSVPLLVTTKLRFIQLAGGQAHNCAVSTSAAMYCWGNNDQGQLGDGTTANRNTPGQVAGSGTAPLTFTAVAGGEHFTCDLTTGAALYCSGNNYSGQLGDGSAGNFRTTPVQVVGSGTAPLLFSTVSTHGSVTCGVTMAHAAYCWGFNYQGQLGDGTTTDRHIPTQVTGSGTGPLLFTSVSNGVQHTCGLTTTGAVYCWGSNSLGQLGDGTTTGHLTPVHVGGSGSAPLIFTSLSAGSSHTCGVTVDNALYCWGLNGNGELGDGTTTSRSAPVQVVGSGAAPLMFTAVSAGEAFNCGLTIGHAVYCWGYGADGELGNGRRTNQLTPVLVTQ